MELRCQLWDYGTPTMNHDNYFVLSKDGQNSSIQVWYVKWNSFYYLCTYEGGCCWLIVIALKKIHKSLSCRSGKCRPEQRSWSQSGSLHFGSFFVAQRSEVLKKFRNGDNRRRNRNSLAVKMLAQSTTFSLRTQQPQVRFLAFPKNCRRCRG